MRSIEVATGVASDDEPGLHASYPTLATRGGGYTGAANGDLVALGLPG